MRLELDGDGRPIAVFNRNLALGDGPPVDFGRDRSGRLTVPVVAEYHLHGGPMACKYPVGIEIRVDYLDRAGLVCHHGKRAEFGKRDARLVILGVLVDARSSPLPPACRRMKRSSASRPSGIASGSTV